MIPTFADLLAPVTVRDLAEKYSERRPLYIQGNPDKVAGLFDRQRLFGIVRGMQERDKSIPLPRAGFRNTAGDHSELEVSPAQVETVLASGMAVTVDRLDAKDPVLRELANDLRAGLGVTEQVAIAATLAPSESGYGLRWDACATWIVQLEGEQRWRYSERPAASGAARPDETKLATSEVRPGDVLYLPPGTWHAAQAQRGMSLQLAIVVQPVPLLRLFERAVASKLSATWQRTPWASWGDIDQRLGRARDELVAALQSLDPAALRARWNELLPQQPASGIDKRTKLRRAVHVRYASTQVGDEEVLLLLNGTRVIGSLAGGARELLDKLSTTDSFVAEQAMAWGDYDDWDEVQGALALLAWIGVLRVDEPSR